MGRSPCCEKTHTNKGAWTKEEDDHLIAYIEAHGEGNWRCLPKAAGLLRCGKSCRLRWVNYLRPDVKRGSFTVEEDNLIIKLHTFYGNKWSLIAARLPGRTDNEIKNHWNTNLMRRLLGRSIDPHFRYSWSQKNDSPVYHYPSRPLAAEATILLSKRDQNQVNFRDEVKSSSRSAESPPTQLRCQDLNLELCLRPPSHEYSPNT